MLYISIVVLLFLSAFFSASETSLSTLNKIRLRKRAEDGDSNAKTALSLSDSYDKTITTILVGNNLVNIALSTIMTLVCTAVFKTYGAVVSTVLATVLVLTFGEILPKSFAAQNADRLAMSVAKPLRVISVVLTPFSYLFGKLQSAFHKRTEPEEKAPTMTEEELLFFIEAIEEEGVLEEQESNLVQSALEFDETTLGEIITPRVNLDALDVESCPEALCEFLLSVNHSRVPVFENSVDNIIGVLFVRNALRYLVRGEEVPLRDLLEEPSFVHKGMKLSALLAEFQSEGVRMAVVLDEYGGTLGIVTLVDLLEELVGDFYDEEEPEEFIRISDDYCEMTGGFDRWDMFEELGIDEEEQDRDYSTVSGWMMNLLRQIPAVGDSVEAGGYRFTVLAMEEKRIARLSAERLTPVPVEGEEPRGDKELSEE